MRRVDVVRILLGRISGHAEVADDLAGRYLLALVDVVVGMTSAQVRVVVISLAVKAAYAYAPAAVLIPAAGLDIARLDRDNRRRVPTPPPRSASYVPRQYDDRRLHSGEQRAPVDPREPGFDARSILVQGLVDKNRAHREGQDRDYPTSSRVHVLGPECFSRAIRAAVIPPNFRLATGVSKFTGESKPDTWLEDYRVAV